MRKPATHKNLSRDYGRAKSLRQNSSLVEQKMWVELRGAAKIWNLKFRRQQPIHPYIVDFICFSLKLVIELDGQSHDYTQEQDRKRAAYLENQGYKVVRYLNDDVMGNIEGVMESLHGEIRRLEKAHKPAVSVCSSPLAGEDAKT
jgi:very-short-patch-repair endonuclease